MFQPRSGNAPNLVSVSNVISKLNPAPTLSTFSGSFISLHPPCPYAPPIHHLLTEIHRYFAPCSPPSIPVLDILSTCKNVHSRHSPPPVSAISYFLPLTCYPDSLLAPEVPLRVLVSYASSPVCFLPSLHPQCFQIPFDPFVCSLLGSILLLPLTQTTPLPCRYQPASRSLPVLIIFRSQVSGLLSSFPSFSLLARSYSSPSIDVFRWFLLVLGVLLRADERPGRIHSLSISRPSPCLRATCMSWRRSGRLDPPPPLSS